MKKNNGFTLLELLLVVALVAVLAVFGVSTYHKKAEKTKIDKTALQMQQILQAGSAYYSNKTIWPSSGAAGFPATPDFASTYIPFGTVPASAWGADYEYHQREGQPDVFQVSTTVPNETIARQIMMRLPFGDYDSAKKQVVAAIGVSTLGSSGPQGMIVEQIGTKDFVSQSGSTLPTFSCPANYTGQVVTAIQSIRSNKREPTGDLVGAYPIYRLNIQPHSPCTKQGDNEYSCKIQGDFTSREIGDKQKEIVSRMPSTGSISVLYITYCKPNPPAS